MTRYGKLLLGAFVLLILTISYFYFSSKPTVTNTPPPTNTTVSVTGCYVANLAKDVYTLQILSQTGDNVSGILAFNNAEKDSSSGTFVGTLTGDILLANYTFSSEGTDSTRQVIFKKVGDTFIEGFGESKTVGSSENFVDVSKVTYDPNSTFTKSSNCLQHFTDASGTVSLDYNAFFLAIPNINMPTIDWMLNAKQKGILLATVSAPRAYMPKTNFSEAKLTIGKSADKTAIKNCLVKDPNEKAGTSKTIGGETFQTFTTNDAGAGNFYDTTSYRGIVDGDCFAIESTIHSTNIGNYSPDQGIKEFDQAKIKADIGNIIDSIKFNLSSN